MNAKTANRDRNIYYLHKTFRKTEDIATKYGLKPNTIVKIIKAMDKKVEERNQFVYQLCDYTKLNHSNLSASFIYSALNKFIGSYEIYHKIFSKEDLINLINTIRIRGIGPKLKAIINEFIESTK